MVVIIKIEDFLVDLVRWNQRTQEPQRQKIVLYFEQQEGYVCDCLF